MAGSITRMESIHYLRALSYRFPTIEAALAEIAHLKSVLALPRGTVHVVSDVHGEFQKLDHILRNGSGSLRPLVERVFKDKLDAQAQTTLLNLIYYSGAEIIPSALVLYILRKLPPKRQAQGYQQIPAQ